MRLESAAYGGISEEWPLKIQKEGSMEILITTALIREVFIQFQEIAFLPQQDIARVRANLAASFQYNLARGIARLALNAAEEQGIPQVALSGGVAYNEQIRETIQKEVEKAGLRLVMNMDYPLGDGCISYGQCVMAGSMRQ